MSTYLLINMGVFFFPLILSFDKRVHFYTHWRNLMPAILVTGIIFILWDIYFTSIGVWGFNERYISTHKFFGLPHGELAFFFTVPYACVFIDACYRAYFKWTYSNEAVKKISLGIWGLMTVLFLLTTGNWYTGSAMLYGMILIPLVYFSPSRALLSKFYISFLIMLIPFFLTNGVLTGTGIEEEIVWYNDAENLGIRCATIPVDDFFYCFDLILSVLWIKDILDRKKGLK